MEEKKRGEKKKGRGKKWKNKGGKKKKKKSTSPGADNGLSGVPTFPSILVNSYANNRKSQNKTLEKQQ